MPDFPCGDLPYTTQKLVWKLDDIRKAAQSVADLDSGDGVLHAKRPPIPLQSVTSDLEFVLEKAVKRGCKLNAQVWTSHLTFRGQRYPITVKFFMGCYSKAEKWTETSTRADFIHSQYEDLAPPEFYMLSERDAYELLASAQGSLVPWSYGFAQFHMPWGETCYGHITEYIDGVDPVDHCKTLSEDNYPAVNSLLVNFFKTYVEIHYRNVFHGPIYRCEDRNLTLLRPVDPLNPKFVVFDFEQGGSIMETYSWNRFWQSSESDRMWNFLESCEQESWLSHGDNDKWQSEFEKGSEEADRYRRKVSAEVAERRAAERLCEEAASSSTGWSSSGW